MRSQIPECSFACIITGRSFDFRRGKLEVRACLSTRGRGRRPLLGGSARDKSSYAPWPACGEIGAMDFCRIIGVAKILANFAREGEKNRSFGLGRQKMPVSHFPAKDPDRFVNSHVWRMDWGGKPCRICPDGGILNEVPLGESVDGGGRKGIPVFEAAVSAAKPRHRQSAAWQCPRWRCRHAKA